METLGKANNLETLGDVQRALARLARRVDKKNGMDVEKAACLRSIYQALAAVMQDRRDTRIAKQVRELWAEREKRGTAPHAEH